MTPHGVEFNLTGLARELRHKRKGFHFGCRFADYWNRRLGRVSKFENLQDSKIRIRLTLSKVAE
jgi:hypothetical protein